MASSWGRKETLITPPTVPVYTFTAFGVALMCLCFFAWQRVAFSMPIMQRSYFTEYVRAAVGTAFHQAGEYRLFYLEGAKRRQPRLALPVDFKDGQRRFRTGRPYPSSSLCCRRHKAIDRSGGAYRRSFRTPRYTVGFASPFSKATAFRACFSPATSRPEYCSPSCSGLPCRPISSGSKF